ncbi:hypothetical protein STRIP9103_05260 [Streptomyces ipomoeae 91-03]|uniref:Uncharacterized protein n=1 Tax=Streptomyces ipomoeae 91-03 TaxID=698759 RepID=L1KUM6_9ACTN|nr:hypothetical protein STRIP9103_05260 [Streptomyces ipomoeae 91-03]
MPDRLSCINVFVRRGAGGLPNNLVAAEFVGARAVRVTTPRGTTWLIVRSLRGR